jgi:peptide/nickel transport system ATP-binding protein
VSTKRHFPTDDERFPDSAGEPLLRVTDLHTGFVTPDGVARAVDGVSLRLERGKTLGLVGESGSGKSVLSRSIMGLLPKRNVVRSGSVVFEGHEIATLPVKELRAYWGTQMSMIFQDPMTSLNPVTRVGAQITESLRTHFDVTREFAKGTAVNLLASVGIPEPERRYRQYPHELSGGMRQRVMIAIALACGPKLLFADEPTTALDVTVQGQILDLLATQQRERFMSVMLVTHDLGVVAGRADEIAVMYAGRIVEQAPASALFRHMKMPYTEALLRSIPKLSDPSHTKLDAIAGRPPSLLHPPPGCKFAPRCPYVQDKCRAEEPPLVAAETTGHLYRCWFPVGSPQPVTVTASATAAPAPGVPAPGPPAPDAPAPGATAPPSTPPPNPPAEA